MVDRDIEDTHERLDLVEWFPGGSIVVDVWASL
jgi:hypothetical protein